MQSTVCGEHRQSMGVLLEILAYRVQLPSTWSQYRLHLYYCMGLQENTRYMSRDPWKSPGCSSMTTHSRPRVGVSNELI